MKKSYYFILLFAFCLCFVGCSEDYEAKIRASVSENCSAYYRGETESFFVNMFSGKREEPYKLDGVRSDLVDYCIISVTPKKEIKYLDNIVYSVEIDGETKEGPLMASPFDNTFECDLGINVSQEKTIFVYIKLVESTEVTKMTCVSSSFTINSDMALTCAMQNILPDLLSLKERGSSECFIQIINKSPSLDTYYWSINFVTEKGDCLTVIIDTQEGKILAKNM